MKPPAAAVKKAVAKKMKKARGSSREGEQEPAPKRLRARVHQPPAQEKPPVPPEIDLTADTPPDRAGAEEAPEGPSAAEPTVTEPQAPSEPPPAGADRSWGEGPSGAASSPPEQPASSPPRTEPEHAEAAEGNRSEPVLRGFSLMNDGRRAEGLMNQVIQPDFLDELRNLGIHRFCREAYSAFIRVANSFALFREVVGENEAVYNQLLQDTEDARARAEAAEEALASVQADCAKKIKEAEGKVETAVRQQQAALSQLTNAESAVEARNLHIADLKSSLQAAEDRAKEAEDKVRKAEEAERTMAASLAKKEAQVVEVEATAEARVASAVEKFRASELFVQEVVEANADYFIQGFEQAKEKIARTLNFPQALEVAPDQESEETSNDEPAADP